MDGKTVWDEEGHSLVSNFGRYLEFLMCGTTPEALTHYSLPRTGTVSRSSGKLRLTLAGSYSFSAGYDILIYAPDYPNLHLVNIPVVSYVTSSPYTITTGFDISGSEYDGLIGQVVSFSAQSQATHKFVGPSTTYACLVSETAHLAVGINSAPVAMDDRHLFAPRLTGANTLVSFSSNPDVDESYLTFSTSFTNDTDAPIVIREVLLRTAGGTTSNGSVALYAWCLLLARDVIDEITIPVGRTLTVTYTIMSKIEKATGTGGANIDSGFTNNLLSGLAGVITSSSQQAGVMIRENGSSVTFTPVSNTDQAVNGNWMFCGSSQARATSRIDSTRSLRGSGQDQWKPGVVLCSEINSTQDVQNYTIVGEIDNGEGSGQLLYLQSWGEAGVQTQTSYSFTLKRLVYNVSGAAIEVKALALVCVSKTAGNYLPSSVEGGSTCLLAQTNLDPTEFFTIPNGKMCIVSYTITIEV